MEPCNEVEISPNRAINVVIRREHSQPKVVGDMFSASLSLLRRWALVLRKTWTLPDTRWFLAVVVFLLAVGIAEAAFTLSHPCLLSGEIYSESCRPNLVSLIVTTWIKVVATAMPTNMLHAPIASAAMAIQRGQKSDSGAWKQAMARGWAPASSREVFYDITKVRQSPAPCMLQRTFASPDRLMTVAFMVAIMVLWSP